MKVFFCEKCNEILPKGKTACGKCGYDNPELIPVLRKHTRRRREIRDLVIIVAVFSLAVILNANLLFPWQRGARRNKQVILEYAEEHYPDARVVEGHYNSARFFVWNNLADAIVFKLDDMEFKIIAEAGKILTDNYPKARACKQFDTIIQAGFFEPREIEARIDYSFIDNYYELYPYTGSLVVRIYVADQGSTPREAGWLYDFYQYWHNEGAFLKSYDVWIKILENDKVIYYVDFKDRDPLLNENEFYSSFERGD